MREVERWDNLRVSGTEVNANSAVEDVFHSNCRRVFFGEGWRGWRMGERWNLINFFSRRVRSESGNSHFPTMVMSTSVVQRTLRRDVARFVSARRFHTEPRPLKSPEDWSDFQLERASYKMLSEYATTVFAAFTHPLAYSRPLLCIWLNPDKGEYFSATPRSSSSPHSLTTFTLRTPCL